MNDAKITKTSGAKPIIIAICCLLLANSTAGQSFHDEIKTYRAKYKAEFLTDENSPLKKKDLKYLRFYEPDETYKVTCTFEQVLDGEPFEMPTYSGKTKTYMVFGKLHFTLHGQKMSLNIYRSLALAKIPKYQDYLFVPFMDLTSAHETYGGGRYLDLRMGELNAERIYLDFNKAYNPYCAFSDGYSCPVPPQANHLKVKIEAGEQNFAKGDLH